MERFTVKNEQFNDYSVAENLRQLDVRDYLYNINQKMGKLEDLEEKIGCPLEVFVRLVKEPYVFVKKAYNWANDKEYEINVEKHVRLECNEIYKNKEYNTWCVGFEQIIGQPPFTETGLFLVKLSDYKVNWCFEEKRGEL